MMVSVTKRILVFCMFPTFFISGRARHAYIDASTSDQDLHGSAGR